MLKNNFNKHAWKRHYYLQRFINTWKNGVFFEIMLICRYNKNWSNGTNDDIFSLEVPVRSNRKIAKSALHYLCAACHVRKHHQKKNQYHSQSILSAEIVGLIQVWSTPEMTTHTSFSSHSKPTLFIIVESILDHYRSFVSNSNHEFTGDIYIINQFPLHSGVNQYFSRMQN